MSKQHKQLIDEFLQSWKTQRTIAREWKISNTTYPTLEDIGRVSSTQVTLTANHFYAIDELIRIYHQYQLVQDAVGRP